ncbi:MAG: type pilus assembly protein PilN [Clostridia bacterium]|nr:type pilus assembly protein PilN [Clostridia bacterium]MDN5323705.1 type pilus assembly protein PilN [Clostridia bacterium]
MAINLLPPKYQPKPLLQWKRLSKVLLISIIAFTMGFSGVNYYFYRMGLDEKLDNLQANIENLKPVFEKVQEYEKTLEAIKKIEQLADKIGKAKQVWSDILADIAGSLEDDIWFVKISKEEDKVFIEGEAKNFSTVGNLAINIRKLQWFKQVDVDNVEKVKGKISSLNTGSIILTENVKFKITAQLKENIKLFTPPEGDGSK